MRVLCINGVNVGDIGKMTLTKTRWVAPHMAIIIEGESYTVANAFNYWGELFYELAERPGVCIYLSTRFIPLSNINELELINTKEEAYA